MAKSNDSLEHRGRFQAQGRGVEESESWAQEKPLSVSKGLGLLGKLIGKLKPKDYERRKKPFKKAQAFVVEAGENGGVFAHLGRSFRVKGSKDERVDIEVLGGKAFVKENNDE